MTHHPKRRWDAEYKDLYQAPNDTYYLRYWSPKLGRDLEVSLKTNVKARALRERKRRLESLNEEKTREAVGYKKFSSVVASFLEDTTFKSESTRKGTLNQINNHLLPWFGNYDPDRIDNNLWRKYALERRAKDPACSLFNAQKYLGKILNWAFQKRITKNKVLLESFDKERKSPGVELSDEQFQAIRNHLNQDWHDIAWFAWEMGMRINEIKKMRWDWIEERTIVKDDQPKLVQILHIPAQITKTRKGRSPVIPLILRLVLRDRKIVHSDSPFVFPGPNPQKPMSTKDGPWQLAKKKAGVECRFHDLRHTWLSRTFRGSNRYAEICEYAGLSLQEAIKTYVKFTVRDMAAIAEIDRSTGENRGAKNNDE